MTAVGPIGNMMNAAGIAAQAAPKVANGVDDSAAVHGDFGNVVVNALQGLEAMQDKSDNLAVKAATGDLTDVHDYTIAATEAALATEFTVAVRNRAVEAFNEIMRMQV